MPFTITSTSELTEDLELTDEDFDLLISSMRLTDEDFDLLISSMRLQHCQHASGQEECRLKRRLATLIYSFEKLKEGG